MENLFFSLASGTSLDACARRKRKSSNGMLGKPHSDSGPSRLSTVTQTKKKRGEIRSSRKKGDGPKQGRLDHTSRNLRLFADNTTTQQKHQSTDAPSEEALRRCKPSDPSSDSKEVGESENENGAAAVAAFRKRLGIKVSGGSGMHNMVPPIVSFSDVVSLLSCSAAATASLRRGATSRSDSVFVNKLDDKKTAAILRNVEQSDWVEPTPVQMQAVPAMLSGYDVMASAPTGSGKTAAFVLPILLSLQSPSKHGVRVVMLAPTRELAAQLHRESIRLAKGTGIRVVLLTKALSVSAGVAESALKKNSEGMSPLSRNDIIVSTPMSLVSTMVLPFITAAHFLIYLNAQGSNGVSLDTVRWVVLDEADKLFDSGNESAVPSSTFLAQVDEVLASCQGTGVKRALFSATLGPEVQELALSILRDPVCIRVGQDHAGAPTISQRLVFTGREEGKLLAMRQLVQSGFKPPVLVFVQSKERAQALFRELVYDGVNVDAIHAGRTPEQRSAIVKSFRSGMIWALICTDLMARGIDFKGINMVINYDLPQSAVAYIHRIGRTGRAGRKGEAVTFFTERDIPNMRSISNVMRLSGCDVPDWLLSQRKLCSRDSKRMKLSAPLRKPIEGPRPVQKHYSRIQKKTSTPNPSSGGGNPLPYSSNE